jgi:ornithine carbamoyltransferase
MGFINKFDFKGRDFLAINNVSPAELEYIIDVAADLKARLKAGEPHPYLAGKALGMIFRKSSTRTRVSFEVGMYQLGGYPLFLSSQDIQLGRGEPISDTARTLSRYLNGIMIRTFDQEEVEALARYAEIPVINGLTDLHHPTQAVADMLTIKEHKGQLQGLKLGFVGDGNNVVHSLIEAGAKLGMKVFAACPPGYEPDAAIVRQAEAEATATGAEIHIIRDPREAAENADALYTDVWASMGQEAEQKQRERVFANYQVNGELLKLAKPDAVVLHCLPAHRGEEISEEVIEGPQSVVFDEAENRLHAHKALLALLL